MENRIMYKSKGVILAIFIYIDLTDTNESIQSGNTIFINMIDFVLIFKEFHKRNEIVNISYRYSTLMISKESIRLFNDCAKTFMLYTYCILYKFEYKILLT